MEAYRYLLRAQIKRRPATDPSAFDRESLIAELHRIKDRRAALWAERDEVINAIELLLPWGEFQLPSPDVSASNASSFSPSIAGPTETR